MKDIFNTIVSFFILFPIVLFILTFIVSKYILHKRKKSIGIAADITTFLLFFSVTHVFSVIFSKNIGFELVICSLIFATVLTFLDWRSKREIEVGPLLRKIWRLLFILLCLFYVFLWLFGVIRYVLSYIS
ncbi:DUF3397 domain-containing protein [Psychrobacillus lasiicapitis]|uniref:DUF3397 domain-containing protein n=1 Tax=Psychrobacillus lasiicapitis TaxID=1636719 RepID=A0A544TEP0_9BACI|nr:DUF3397 domain-containing protein [Psychrobacillus lasiicapitis]